MIVALGVAWILDGLQITIASTVASTFTDKQVLGLSSGAVGLIATVYLIGEVGALFFGRVSDKLGRKNLFTVTLGIYLFGSGLTALTLGSSGIWVAFLYATRILAGIGGEYAAINSAINEMMPARFRGRVDVAVNGTYWAGALLATVAQLAFLNNLPKNVGWRLGFLLRPVLGLVIIFVRRHLPESPRWLIMDGREQEAEAEIAKMERWVCEGDHLDSLPPVYDTEALEIKPSATSATPRCFVCCSGRYRADRCSAPP